MEQVARASVFEFFRLVRFHGGKSPYLSWYEPDEMPIVMMSPVVKLTEGVDFAFGARWALIQHHAWRNRREFLDLEDDEVKRFFREWIESRQAPWYVEEKYIEENKQRLNTARANASHASHIEGATLQGEGDELDQPAPDVSVTEDSSEDELPDEGGAENLHVFKMLYKGEITQVDRHQERQRKSGIFNNRHNFYKHTRCTSVVQEEQSAMPAGVINRCEDSDDGEAYSGEQKEINQELPELRVVQHWINQSGWDAASEGRAMSSALGKEVELRLDWDEVARKLARGAEASVEDGPAIVREDVVLNDYPLDSLDPTQRAFAERVLKWGDELVKVYKQVQTDGKQRKIPKIRSWLCGSAGSGKSTTLKTIVQHLRLKFQSARVPATVELTAYTGVAAFNIGFGAQTACSSFQVFPNAPWRKELTGEKLKRLENQWEHVALLIVDEISFIGSAFFAQMHHRLQQGKRRYFSEMALDPEKAIFGDLSFILVGDFGQLEPIDDISLCDVETRRASAPPKVRPQWGLVYKGRLLLSQVCEAIVLTHIHRSKDDMDWTESCLRLRDFTCTWEDYEWWRQHDLDRGHLNEEQKAYFEEFAVWLCARCEDVGTRNGRKLAHLAEDEKKLVHQIAAEHSAKGGKKHPSSAFEGLRHVIHLVKGCFVMLTRNVAYKYGLANGTRGKLVGVVYGPGGLGSFPDAIVVEVSEYCGPEFYPGEPKRVPI